MTDDFRALFDANPRAMLVFESDTLAIVEANHAACALYECSRDELLAMTLRDIRLPEDVPRFEHAFAESRTQTTPPRRASRHRARSGRLLEVVLDMTRVTFGGAPAVLMVITDITGVREQEERLRLLVEHSRDGFSVVDTDGRVAYMSPGGERLLGFKPGEWVGRRATENMHPEDVASYSPIAPGESRVQLSRARHSDGSWRWIETTNFNLTLDPAIRGHVANFRDVTRRIELERAAEANRKRLEHLLSVTSAVTWTARPEGGCTFISANVRDVLGYDPTQYYTSGFWISNVHPEDRPMVEAGLRELAAHGSHDFEYRYRHADGSVRWILDQARLVGGELVGCMIDVTDRKGREESLRRSEEQFRALIERSPMMIVVHRAGRIVFVNPAATAALGYDRADELVGTQVLDLVHPEDRDSVRDRIAHTIAHGGGAPGEARMRRRDGTYMVSEGEGLVLDFDGEPSSVVIGNDVTERKELFARMALADRLLSVGTLAAGVAHEINNPLAYVTSNLELLRRELPLLLAGQAANLAHGEVEELLTDARDGAARVGAIVRDLRALSRSDDDQRGPVDIASVLASCIKMAHNEIRHRARVVSELEDGMPATVGNASRLGQVFLNLLVNAAQAIPEGRPGTNEIRVRAFAAPESRQVIVEIEDTGSGIPRHLRGRIFDPFFTTKPVGLGTGLGLSISHQIVRAVGGTVSVDSEVGVGTTFRVALPIARVTVANDEPVAAPRPGSGTRVLVIDDEAAVCRSIALLLSPDYEVTPVTRAHEALARIAAGEQFDAIVCDVMMPEMTGIELYHRLASVAPHFVERVVFLTGGAFTQQAREFLASVSGPQLEKPFSEQDLRRAIEAVRLLSVDPA